MTITEGVITNMQIKHLHLVFTDDSLYHLERLTEVNLKELGQEWQPFAMEKLSSKVYTLWLCNHIIVPVASPKE